MTEFMSKLQIKMENDLRIIGLENDRWKCYRRSLAKVKEVFVELEAFLETSEFSGEAEEICYLKEWAPLFYGRLFYFEWACKIAIYQSLYSTFVYRIILKREQEKVLDFLKKNREFSSYLDMRRTELDQEFFTYAGCERMCWLELKMTFKSKFCPGSYWAALITANRYYLDLIDGQLSSRP